MSSLLLHSSAKCWTRLFKPSSKRLSSSPHGGIPNHGFLGSGQWLLLWGGSRWGGAWLRTYLTQTLRSTLPSSGWWHSRFRVCPLLYKWENSSIRKEMATHSRKHNVIGLSNQSNLSSLFEFILKLDKISYDMVSICHYFQMYNKVFNTIKYSVLIEVFS